MAAKTILITGATGFVGQRAIDALCQGGWKVRALCRKNQESMQFREVECIQIDDIASQESWKEIVEGCYAVVHLAARVHRESERSTDALAEYIKVNTDATRNLASGAAESGVQRFVFLSSIKAEGAVSGQDSYGYSKALAEEELRGICSRSGMEYVIIRPPLIYGPGVKANFLKLIRLVDKGIPLPFGSVANRRSFIGLDNLVDFIMHVLDHPAAGNRTFSISDGEDLSTPDLIRRIAEKLGKKARLFPCPEIFLNSLCRLTGKKNICERLLGSLAVDDTLAKEMLHWVPVKKFDQELEQTISDYVLRK